jgi:hypothetical protein
MKAQTSQRICKDCNYKVRGKNHEEGEHHKNKKREKGAPKKRR